MSIRIFEASFIRLAFLFHSIKLFSKKGAKPKFVLQRLKLCAIMLSRNISRESALVMNKVKISIQLF